MEREKENGHKKKFEYKEHPDIKENYNAYKLFYHYVINYIDTYKKLPKNYDNNYHRSNVTIALGFWNI